MNSVTTSIEKEWKNTGTIIQKDYTKYTEQTVAEMQKLNTALRDSCSKFNDDKYSKNVNQLLALEQSNFKTTLNVFLTKLACFELIKKNADDSEVIKKEKEVSTLRGAQASIREEINDFITNLKYQFL